jgi:RNA polymerase sigma factor (sigma-70 family)
VNPVAAVRRTSAPDGVLVQQAAAGGGGSYAALYDRYAQQVYNYCLRLTGSPEDAADATQDAFVKVLGRLQHDESPVLDFASYLFTAARNESYALMRKRSRTQLSDETPEPTAPVPDVETDPERAALLRDSQEAVRKANAGLAPRHREVLALREVAGRSYDEIGEIMGISENAAAQLIWRARSKLKVALTAGAVASVVPASDDCETAQVLINRLHDGEPITDEEHMWLDEHLDHCGSCRAARGMILEVAASYRAWAPVALLVAMRPDVLTAAGAAIGADWSGVHAASAAHAAGGAKAAVVGRGAVRTARRSHMAAGGAVGATVLAIAGIAISALLGDDEKVANKATPPPPTVPKVEATPKKSAARQLHAAQIATLERAVAPPLAAKPATKPAAKAPKKHAAAPREKPKQAPHAKPAPRVERPAPAPRVAPTPRARGECTWPGHGQGPGGCPPGHGGTPPGHGGTAPGRAKHAKAASPQATIASGTGKIPPGHGGTPPGHAKHG